MGWIDSIKHWTDGGLGVGREIWDGLTASSIGQMVGLVWVEKLQGNANGLTETMDIRYS